MIRSYPLLSTLALVGTGLLAACGSGPVKSEQSGRLRSELAVIQSNPELASRAPIAIKAADAAVTAAEQPQSSPALSQHLDYIADRKVKIAKAQAEARYAEDKLRALQEPVPPAAVPQAQPPAPPAVTPDTMPEPAPTPEVMPPSQN